MWTSFDNGEQKWKEKFGLQETSDLLHTAPYSARIKENKDQK